MAALAGASSPPWRQLTLIVPLVPDDCSKSSLFISSSTFFAILVFHLVPGLYLVHEGTSGLYLVHEGTSGLYLVHEGTSGLYLVHEGTSGLYLVHEGTSGLYLVDEGTSGPTSFTRAPLGFTWFTRAPPGFTWFTRVPLGFTSFTRAPLDLPRSQGHLWTYLVHKGMRLYLVPMVPRYESISRPNSSNGPDVTKIQKFMLIILFLGGIMIFKPLSSLNCLLCFFKLRNDLYIPPPPPFLSHSYLVVETTYSRHVFSLIT